MNPYDIYIKQSVETSSPLRQIVLLYEHAIVAIKGAIEDMTKGDVKSKVNNIYKAQEIIRALDSALDYEKGGEIAKNLHQLYDFAYYALAEAHAKNDRELLEEVSSILSTLLEGWKGIEKK